MSGPLGPSFLNFRPSKTGLRITVACIYTPGPFIRFCKVFLSWGKFQLYPTVKIEQEGGHEWFRLSTHITFLISFLTFEFTVFYTVKVEKLGPKKYVQ